jgi:hypothetical protein
VARDGGGRWAEAAARCLRNPSERKREKTSYCLNKEREIEERWAWAGAILLKMVYSQRHETAPGHIPAIARNADVLSAAAHDQA